MKKVPAFGLASCLVALAFFAAVGTAATPAEAQSSEDDGQTMTIEVLQPPPRALPPASELLGSEVTVLANGLRCGVIPIPGGEADSRRGEIIAEFLLGTPDQPASCHEPGARISFINGYGHELFTRTTFRPTLTFVIQNLAPRAGLPGTGSGGLAGREAGTALPLVLGLTASVAGAVLWTRLGRRPGAGDA